MSANDLVMGGRYTSDDGYLGKYQGSYVSKAFFEDIRQSRSIRIHQFFGSGGFKWLTEREVEGRVTALA